eukprot:COSAG01_NODE_40104_length_467_cov_6.103261_1_plen_59_part_10
MTHLCDHGVVASLMLTEHEMKRYVEVRSVGTEKRPMMFSRGGPTLSTRSSPFDCSLWIF